MSNNRTTTGVTMAMIAALSSIFWSAPGIAAESMHETRSINGSITAVRLTGPIDLSISQGETRGITIDATADELAKIKIEVINGELTVRYEQGATGWLNISPHRPPRASIAIPDLHKVAVVGSGDVAMSAINLNEGKLEIDVIGSGDVKLAGLKAKTLAVSIRGSGDVVASGQVAAQDISIAGSGDYAGNDLQSLSTAIAIRGSGDAKVWATESLSVSIAGSGDVSYRGQAKLQQAIAGSGEVQHVQ